MDESTVNIVIETLAHEIEALKYRMKLYEDDNERLRIKILDLKEEHARIDVSQLHAHSTTADMISPEVLKHE